MLAIKPATAPPKMKPVLRIRIRMDPELLPGSGIKVPDPDPAKSKRAYKIVKILLFDWI